MSNFHAVATVTAALQARLLSVVQNDVLGATVTALRPGDPGLAGIPTTGVNLFLYQVHVNGALRNADLPTRDGGGALVRSPTIPLDLDYLITFYGEQNFAAHQLLGSVMCDLHAVPVLTPAMISSIDGAPGATDSGLARQVERVSFTPLPLSIEDLSKLWTVFFQTSYALTVAYRASVVLIASEPAPAAAPPVKVPQVTTVTFAQPQVTAVVAAGADPAAPILPGSSILIRGTALAGSGAVAILVGTATIVPTSAGGGALLAVLPADLPAGAQGLRVRQDILVGTPPSPRPGLASPMASFILHPSIATQNGTFAVTVAGLQGTGTAPRGATIGVTVAPPAGAGQQAVLELLGLDGTTRFVFRETARTASAAALAFPVSGVPPGSYVLRVLVDGAETPLSTDTTPGSPTLGQPLPQVVLA